MTSKTQNGFISEFKIGSVKAEDSGTYICKASNQYGEAIRKYRLTVEGNVNYKDIFLYIIFLCIFLYIIYLQLYIKKSVGQ